MTEFDYGALGGWIGSNLLTLILVGVGIYYGMKHSKALWEKFFKSKEKDES